MTPYYADESVTLHHGDCLAVMREDAGHHVIPLSEWVTA